jgi:hypothetical protein
MSFWDDVLALGPTLLWKLNEASGTVAADATGNGKNGTYPGGSITLGHASIILNVPDTAAGKSNTNNEWVTRADEAALRPGASFTALVSVRPTSLAAQVDVVGKVDSWQVWQDATTGRLWGHISPAWASFQSSDNAAGKLVVNNNYLLGIRQDAAAARASLWINGVKVGEITKSSALSAGSALRCFGSSTGGSRAYVGRQQGFAYWPTVALSDAQMVALHASWAAPPTVPPDAPSLISPTEGQVVDRILPVEFEDVSATGTGSEPTEYMVEHEASTGAGWSILINWTTSRNHSVYVGAFADGSDHRLRAYARKGVAASNAGAVRTFGVLHDTTPPNASTPEVTWLSDVPTFVAVGFRPGAFSSSIPGAIRVGFDYEVHTASDFSSPLLTGSGGSKGARVLSNLLLHNSDYWLRTRDIDDVGSVGVWSIPVRFRTTRMYFSSVSIRRRAEDISGGGRHGFFALLPGPTHTVVDLTQGPYPHYPGHLQSVSDSEVGVLFNPPGHVQQVIWWHDGGAGYDDTEYGSGPPLLEGGAVPYFAVTIDMTPGSWPSFSPEYPLITGREIWGSPSQGFLFHKNNGDLVFRWDFAVGGGGGFVTGVLGNIQPGEPCRLELFYESTGGNQIRLVKTAEAGVTNHTHSIPGVSLVTSGLGLPYMHLGHGSSNVQGTDFSGYFFVGAIRYFKLVWGGSTFIECNLNDPGRPGKPTVTRVV